MQIPAFCLQNQYVIGKQYLLPDFATADSNKDKTNGNIEHYYGYAASQLLPFTVLYMLMIWRYSRFVIVPGLLIAPAVVAWNAKHMYELATLRHLYVDPNFTTANSNKE